jgi:plasmid stabilization system protein ParE
MARVVVSPYAIADQDDILRYLHREAGLPTVEKYDAAFRGFLLRLADSPGIGSLRPELGDGIRIWVIPPYVVIYEGSHNSDAVIVHRIVHGRRNIQPDLIER